MFLRSNTIGSRSEQLSMLRKAISDYNNPEDPHYRLTVDTVVQMLSHCATLQSLLPRLHPSNIWDSAIFSFTNQERLALSSVKWIILGILDAQDKLAMGKLHCISVGRQQVHSTSSNHYSSFVAAPFRAVSCLCIFGTNCERPSGYGPRECAR